MKDLQTVVVGFDGSDNALRAVDAAADAVGEGGTVHVVVAFTPLSENEAAYFWYELPEEFRSTFDPMFEPHQREAKAVETLAARGVPHQTHVINGKPAASILETAETVDADLIVVGSRGLGRAARFARGSVSTRVATNATTSVLIVHHE